jgi:hypothetical protein
MSYRTRNETTITNGRPTLESFLNIIAQPGHLYDLYRDCVSQDVIDIRPFVQLVELARYAYISPNVPGEAGKIVGACMPANTAQVITRRGEIADRHNVSSLHLPGVPVASVINSFLTDAHRLVMTPFANKSVESVVASDGTIFSPCAYRRDNPAESRVLLEAFPQTTVRILRRRTVGLGA